MATKLVDMDACLNKREATDGFYYTVIGFPEGASSMAVDEGHRQALITAFAAVGEAESLDMACAMAAAGLTIHPDAGWIL